MLHDLIIGGVRIGLGSSHQISQSYETLGGGALLRMLSGSAHLQNHWQKLRTVITGSGPMPEGLDGLDYSATMSLHCMRPLSLWSASTTGLSIPASRRADWLPHGYAVAKGMQIATPISIAGNAVTFTAVDGADGYVVAYYPILTVYAKPPSRSFAGRGAEFGWSLTAEEA